MSAKTGLEGREDYRRLYADDVLVAEDTDGALVNCNGGPNLGDGRNAAAGTIRSRLIDDVRIHSRVIKP